jgi:hypothetical protein
MPLNPPFARAVFNFSGPDGPPWITELWYSVTGTFPSNYNIATTAALFDTDFESKFRGVMNNQYAYRGVDFHVNNGGVSNSFSTYKNDAGTEGGAALPNEVSALYRLVTAAGGRTGRGRLYLGGLDADFINAGRLIVPLPVVFTTLSTAMKTTITDQGVSFHPAVYSRKDSILYNISDIVVEVPLGTQRRRRSKR